MINRIENDSVEEKLEIFRNIKELFTDINNHALKVTLPTLFIEVTKLMEQVSESYKNDDEKCNEMMTKISQFVFDGVRLLPSPECSDLIIYLFTMCTVRIDRFNFSNSDEVVHEFLSKVN